MVTGSCTITSLAGVRCRPAMTSLMTVCFGLASMVASPCAGVGFPTGVSDVVQDEADYLGGHGGLALVAQSLKAVLEIARNSKI